jgi:REP element-mobilizing transposase RayT
MTIHQKDTAREHQIEIEYPKVETTQETLPVTPSFIEMDPSPRNDPVTSAEVQLESETLYVHDLAYACLLLPRLPTHLITGELPELLNREITRLCVAFGWRLEHLALRPQYLHWVVSVGPEVAAAQVIQEIRQHTSALVFESFPRFEKENPSGDFWAQGFMVVHGRRALDGVLVQDFIQQTRIRQGYEDL